MFTDQVKTLPLEFTGVRFLNTEHYYDWLTRKGEIDPNFLIEDVLLPLDKDQPSGQNYDPYVPDFWIRGTFNWGTEGQLFPYLVLDPRGLHYLYVTGIPKGLTKEASQAFRGQDLSFLYYWEDTKYGYLTQIIKSI